MRLNFSFTVTARIAEINDTNSITKEDIELEFDIPRCEAFLMRFYEEIIVDNYKIKFTYTDSHQVSAIYLQDVHTKTIYVVVNAKQVFMDVKKGYRYLVVMDKMADIMEFDFNAALEFQDQQDIKDEFEE